MPARLMPLTITLVILGAISGVLLATVGASDPPARPGADAGGGGVAAACAVGHPDCQDTIVEPGDGSMNMCIENVPDCNDMVVDESPPDAVNDPGDGPAVSISVDFSADYTQADLDLVTDIIVQFDHDADVLVLERFPPTANSYVSGDASVCDELTPQLEAVHGVAHVECEPYLSGAPSGDPDRPVSNEPGSGPITSADGIDPDECNAVHNINACTPDELRDLGLEPCAPPARSTPAGCAGPGYE